MRLPEPTTRTPNLPATTLVAFVALAAALPGWQAAGASRATAAEARAVLAQPIVVRAMAAAVAAAARDFVNAESKVAITTFAWALPMDRPRQATAPIERFAAPPQPRILAERLLDLPPPVC